jgi:2-polyprenyl-3-methyl-5-hydroxy-6-metoxy-1,4-benzoquinol methylase
MREPPPYYERLAAAFVRGPLAAATTDGVHAGLLTANLDTLSPGEWLALIAIGESRGLRLHRFKRTIELPHVRKVLGALRGMHSHDLLDVGTGRGAFVWPLLDAFPALSVTAVDTLLHRVQDLQAVHDGGVATLSAIRGDAVALPFAAGAFDVVLLLDVLEHIADAQKALMEACRVARRFVTVSVPSKPDSNPEHIHAFEPKTLVAYFAACGMNRVTVDAVPNHFVLIARGEAS